MASLSKRASRLVARTKVQSAAKAAIATRAVAYLRVSTDEQASSGYGLEAQERAVRAFIESQSYELIEIVADPGVSGATRPALRPGFARVLELAAERRFSVLVVHKIDRLARDMRHAVTTVSEFAEQRQISFRSVAESVIDTSNPMGRMIFALDTTHAPRFREQKLARNGEGVNSITPFQKTPLPDGRLTASSDWDMPRSEAFTPGRETAPGF